MDAANDTDVGDNIAEICAETEFYTPVRFVFIAVASLAAILGVAANALLMRIFVRNLLSSSRNGSNGNGAVLPMTFYPVMLALLDLLICAVYILIFGVDAVIAYLHVEWLFTLYYLYIIPAFVTARITQISIPYILILATLERLCWIGGGSGGGGGGSSPDRQTHQRGWTAAFYSLRGRQMTLVLTMLLCVALRLPTAWSTKVSTYPDCDDFFRSLTMAPADWTLDNTPFYVFDFHILSIAQTFVPFAVLVVLNVTIVRRLQARGEPEPTALEPENGQTARKKSASTWSSARRAAIVTMVAIVTSYLISNTLHLVLTILERSESELLVDPDDPGVASSFHTAFSDAVSFVYMFTSAIRVLIYYACNGVVRAQIRSLLRDRWRQRWRRLAAPHAPQAVLV